MKKILLTTDLSEESKVAFSAAIEYAKAFDCEIDLLAIIEDPAQAAMIYALDFPVQPDSEIQMQMQQKVMQDLENIKNEYFQGVSVKPVILEANGPVHTEIIKYAKQNSTDLIIMATHGRTGLSRILIGSITEKVVREAPCQILTVPRETTGKS